MTCGAWVRVARLCAAGLSFSVVVLCVAASCKDASQMRLLCVVARGTGCVLYTCLAGYTPFDVDSRTPDYLRLTKANILSGNHFPFTEPVWEPISTHAKVARFPPNDWLRSVGALTHARGHRTVVCCCALCPWQDLVSRLLTVDHRSRITVDQVPL